jgi:dTDP-4-amino-4,6-dideoxygalactose transaminase
LLVDPRGDEEYAYEVVGFNYRMTEMAAAIGMVQLAALEARNERRREHARQLTAGLRDLPWMAVPGEPAGFRHVYHQYTIRTRERRDDLSRHLTESGIASRVYYPKLRPHTPAYRHRGFDGIFPNAERLTHEVLSLPVHPSLRVDEIAAVVEAVRAFPGVAS